MEQEVIKMSRELTYGEKMVGVTFNPSKNFVVESIKQQNAVVINSYNDLRQIRINELMSSNTPANSNIIIIGNNVIGDPVVDFYTEAINNTIVACMLAVKAVTWS